VGAAGWIYRRRGPRIARLSVLIQGELIAQALLWLIVPVTVVGYLLAPAGRQALKG
jgi:hypothetical protein